MLRWLAGTLYDYPALAKREGRPQLLTISYSHFNEYSRWALELGGIPFDEHGFAPGQHVLPALSVRVPRSGPRHLATTSSMGPHNRPSPTALPLLVLPSGAVCADSWAIGAASGLAPMDAALQGILDMELGVAARKMAYCYLLKPAHAARFTTMCTEGRHWAWRALWHLGGGAALRGMLCRAFRPEDEAGLAACMAQLEGLMANSGPLAAALAAARQAGQPYLGGASPGQADLALASCAALLVLPEEYGGHSGTMAPHFAYLLSREDGLRGHVQRFRETEVGRFVLDLYKRHRLQ